MAFGLRKLWTMCEGALPLYISEQGIFTKQPAHYPGFWKGNTQGIPLRKAEGREGDNVARRKAAQNCTVLPWLSEKQDCKEGRFLQVGNSLLLSKRFQALPPTAQILYIVMANESGRNRSFEFPQTAAKKYGFAPTTFRRAVDELIKAGMITKQSGQSARAPNLYEFCFDWKKQPF